MPTCQTKFHGTLSYEPEQVLHIPGGLFGFPQETQFLLLELPSARPMAFLQSVRSSDLCFISLPAQVIQREYRLSLKEQDLKTLGYSAETPPAMGRDVLCLALLTIGERRPSTANLLAPVVIDIAKHRGMQVIMDAPYSHQYPIPASELSHSADQ
jgi:flagellar assembly factor FliW